MGTHRLQRSSFLGLPCRILNININHKKELLWSLWVVLPSPQPKVSVLQLTRSIGFASKRPRRPWPVATAKAGTVSFSDLGGRREFRGFRVKGFFLRHGG